MTIDDVQNETFVGIWEFLIVADVVRQIQARVFNTVAQTWRFAIDLEVNGLLWLDTDDEFVEGVGRIDTELPAVQPARYLTKLHRTHKGDVVVCLPNHCRDGITWTRISARLLLSAFPAFNRKGTPAHRELLMNKAIAAKVGVMLPARTRSMM